MNTRLGRLGLLLFASIISTSLVAQASSWEITGAIASIIAAIIAFLLLLGACVPAIAHYSHAVRRFRVDFSETIYDALPASNESDLTPWFSDGGYTDRITLRLDASSEKTIKIRIRQDIPDCTLRIRCVTPHWFWGKGKYWIKGLHLWPRRWSDVDPSIVTPVRARDFRLGGSLKNYGYDGVAPVTPSGSVSGGLRKSTELGAFKECYFLMCLRAQESWDGFLRFEFKIDSGRYPFTRVVHRKLIVSVHN